MFPTHGFQEIFPVRDEQEESNDGEKLAENSFIDESEN